MTYRPELSRALDLEVEARGADLAPRAAAERVSMLAPERAVEAGRLVIGVQPVEVHVDGQHVQRTRAKYPEELAIHGGLVETVFVDDRDCHSPERNDRPFSDTEVCGSTVEALWNL